MMISKMQILTNSQRNLNLVPSLEYINLLSADPTNEHISTVLLRHVRRKICLLLSFVGAIDLGAFKIALAIGYVHFVLASFRHFLSLDDFFLLNNVVSYSLRQSARCWHNHRPIRLRFDNRTGGGRV